MSPDFEDARADLIEHATRLGGRGREAVRIADLLTAHALGRAAGLLGPFDFAEGARAHLERTVALLPVRASADRSAWRRAVAAAEAVATQATGPEWMHLWSASSQAHDPGRKGRGAYGTPPELAEVMAEQAVRTRVSDRPVVIDPSAGHGALLTATYRALRAEGVPPRDAVAALHGVELDPHARELCCLSVWLAAADAGCSLAEVADRIRVGNALCAEWSAPQGRLGMEPTWSPAGEADFAWEKAFSVAFAQGGFDVVIANPPWESLRHGVEETDEQWLERCRTRERLSQVSGASRSGLPPLYSAQGRGDRNLFKGFVELFPHLLAPGGTLVALLPGAFASDLGLEPARRLYLDHLDLHRWTGFENLAGYFPIDGRYKYGILHARRDERGTRHVRLRFLARSAVEAQDARGHVTLSRRHLEVVGGRSAMLPEITDRDELSVLARACDTGAPFFDESGPFGAISYRREMDLTTDRRAGRFMHVQEARRSGFTPAPDGTWSDGRTQLWPLVEGRMVGAYDFFQKSWRSGQGRTARWELNGDAGLERASSQFVSAERQDGAVRLAICDVTSATNRRTMLATWVPPWSCGNTAPVLRLADPVSAFGLLAVLNSMTFDWILRRIASGLHLNRFYLEATPLPSLSPRELHQVAAFARGALEASPRFAALAPRDRGAAAAPPRAVRPPAEPELEAIVARGYGLTAVQMRRILSRDRRDRKGLWRYFAAEPRAQDVALEAIRLLEAA